MHTFVCAASLTLGLILVACGAADNGAGDPGASGSGGDSSGAGGQAGDTVVGSAGAAGVVEHVGTSGGGGAGSAGSGHGGSSSSAGASGSANNGGASAGAGDAGMLPHTLGKCDGLGPIDTWEQVTPPYVTAHPSYTGVLVPLVNPQNPAIVYVTSDSDGVFKSTDCGATWTKTNTGRNAKELDSGRIWAAVLDPVQPDTLYALTGYGAGGLWKTTNGGVDWDQMLAPGSEVATVAGNFTERVAMDPTDHLHLLVNFHQNCGGNHTPVCFGESKDGGVTWKVIDFPKTLASGWGEGSGLMILKSNVWLYEEGELFYTGDAGGTWKTVTPNGAQTPCFPGDSTITRTPDGSYYLGSISGVLTSPDGASWSLIANSGGKLCPVIGDGSRLFAATLNNPETIYAASYADPKNWTKLAATGLPTQLTENMYVFGYDADHHLLYGTAQSAGLWRVVTH